MTDIHARHDDHQISLFVAGRCKYQIHFKQSCLVQIVFAEHWWIGTKEANPEERRLPLPLDLQQAAEEGRLLNACTH